MSEITTDVIVVGSGAAGLVAALTAREEGLDVIVVESDSLVGGSTGTAPGTLWLPGHGMLGKKVPSLDEALDYLNASCGPETPASSAERRAAFIESAGDLATWLTEHQIGLRLTKHPDYYPGSDGTAFVGRTLEPKPVDADALGEWRERCRLGDDLPATSTEIPWLSRGLTTFRGFGTVAKVVVGRTLSNRLSGHHVVTGGAALVTGLVRRLLDADIALWREAPLLRLHVDEGRVAGVVVRRDGVETIVVARRGVVLAAGGFEAAQAMRATRLPRPNQAAWTLGCPTATGDAIEAATRIGATTDLMDDAWWTPVFLDEDGHPLSAEMELSLPHGIMVDSAGDRYVNEAAPGFEVGRAMYDRHATTGVTSVPSYLIIDEHFRRRYPLRGWLPAFTPKKAIEAGAIIKADSVAELAEALGVDEAGLTATIVRWNHQCKSGKDADFQRGDAAHDRVHGDAGQRKNPCMGPLSKPPFWALKVYPGDLGTKGGLLTDVDGQVLRADGAPVEGLFAVGGSSATVMGHGAPGRGAGLAAACVFALRAGRALAR